MTAARREASRGGGRTVAGAPSIADTEPLAPAEAA
ncbi:hypothetical protein ATK36_0399 [Amycolatopsis sulphurea]|uniref:Uncharacterized protein n=1 Tax=Amycolatopsis sulphurea TaxID=76022 RepID=A0A2A9FZG9_9PSEU|nr:hypothetical protein ATK36_0399 [Amycolatopsis sulphurea]